MSAQTGVVDYRGIVTVSYLFGDDDDGATFNVYLQKSPHPDLAEYSMAEAKTPAVRIFLSRSPLTEYDLKRFVRVLKPLTENTGKYHTSTEEGSTQYGVYVENVDDFIMQNAESKADAGYIAYKTHYPNLVGHMLVFCISLFTSVIDGFKKVTGGPAVDAAATAAATAVDTAATAATTATASATAVASPSTIVFLQAIACLGSPEYVREEILKSKYVKFLRTQTLRDRQADLYEQAALLLKVYCNWGFVPVGSFTPVPESGNEMVTYFGILKSRVDQADARMQLGFKDTPISVVLKRPHVVIERPACARKGFMSSAPKGAAPNTKRRLRLRHTKDWRRLSLAVSRRRLLLLSST